LDNQDREWFLKVIDLLKQRSRRVSDFAERARPFLSDSFPFEKDAVKKHLTAGELEALIPQLADDFAGLKAYSAGQIEESLRRRAEVSGVKAGMLIHAARVLVLGMGVSPGIFEVLELIGQNRTVSRLRAYPQVLSEA
jgi:glutamyl-tRNA synthetase/nondiscriminating glutamyl-tRNA synthetase